MGKRNTEYEAAFDYKLLQLGMQLGLHKIPKNKKGGGAISTKISAQMATWQADWYDGPSFLVVRGIEGAWPCSRLGVFASIIDLTTVTDRY